MALPSHAPGRLAAGAALPFRALVLLGREGRLWRYALLPILLTAAGLTLALISLWPVSARLLQLVWSDPGGILGLLWGGAHLVVFLVLVLTAAVALPSLLSAPFTDQLSEQVEAIELGTGSSRRGGWRLVSESALSIAHAAARTAVLAAGHLLLLFLLLIPGVGIAYPALAFLWSASWLAFEYLDVPMARHLHRFSTIRAALRRVRPLSLGFGGVLAVALLLPLAGLLVVPVGTVGGTLLYCDLVRAGLVPREAGADSPTPARETCALP